ncbi:hypothetical protein DFH09DRAFT_1314771 [Mycena vulgaris]|nr:hypothetical protein DFH09DRAFT_1314771 [Mycena vulgaris]
MDPKWFLQVMAIAQRGRVTHKSESLSFSYSFDGDTIDIDDSDDEAPPAAPRSRAATRSQDIIVVDDSDDEPIVAARLPTKNPAIIIVDDSDDEAESNGKDRMTKALNRPAPRVILRKTAHIGPSRSVTSLAYKIAPPPLPPSSKSSSSSTSPATRAPSSVIKPLIPIKARVRPGRHLSLEERLTLEAVFTQTKYPSEVVRAIGELHRGDTGSREELVPPPQNPLAQRKQFDSPM